MGKQTNGCGSCKRRKVKCDNTRPNCTRCLKAGLQCTGFGQRLRFIDENPRLQRPRDVSNAQSREFSATVDSHTVFQQLNPAHHSLVVTSPYLPSTLPLTAFKDQIFMSYLFSKFFGGDCGGKHRCGLPKEWSLELVKTSQKPRHQSWDALAAIVFGQAHKSHDLNKNALLMYGDALMELCHKLSNPDDRRSDSILASITALSIFETLGSKTEDGWMSHANGLGSLLEWRGPLQQKSYVGTAVSLDHRIMLVAKSLISRESTFLHNPIWKTVPWADDPASKQAADYLVDIGTDLAEYFSQIRLCDDSDSYHVLRYSQIRTQVVATLEDLNTWWQEWELRHAVSAWEVPSNSATHKLFSTILEYDNIWTAYTVSIYNSMRILLLQLWHKLELVHDPLRDCDQNIVLDTPNETVLLGISSDIKGLAYEILRSLTYSYGESRRLVNTSSFLFIQGVAYGCFDRNSREALWIVEHGWADVAIFPDIEEANLLKGLFPLREIKILGLT